MAEAKLLEDKFLNAFEYFHASTTFATFLIGDEFDRVDSSYLDQIDKELYAKLLVTHSALLMALFKEKVLVKDEDKNISLNIYQRVFDLLMSNLYEQDGEKYKLGDMSFDSKKEIFDLIRNKLLHGDYAIDLDGYKIVLNNKGVTGSINIVDLVETCKVLTVTNESRLVGENRRAMVLAKRENVKYGPNIYNPSQLKKFMKDVWLAVFTDKPEDGHERDERYAYVLEKFYIAVQNCTSLENKQTLKSVVKATYDRFLPILKSAHIELSYDMIPASVSEYYENVQEYYLKNRGYIDSLLSDEKRAFMMLYLNNIQYAKVVEHGVLAAGLLNNIKLLSAYLSDVPISEVDYLESVSNTYVDDMSIAAVFAQFYACYHYELDELYSNGIGTSLKDIANGTYLDFSKLDLYGLYDPSMTTDNGFNDFSNQLEHLENSIEKIRIKKEGAEIAFENYSKRAKQPSEETKQRLLDNISTLVNEYNKALTTLENAREFMNNRYEDYVRNYNIISHIRNAFAHGNVRILHHTEGDTLNDRMIVIEDNYEGANTYRLVIKYNDFVRLFNKYNSEVLYSFIFDKARGAAKNKGLIYVPE